MAKVKPKPQFGANVAVVNSADFEEGGKEQFLKIGEQSLHCKKTIRSLVTEAAAMLKNIATTMVTAVIKTITGGLLRKKTAKDIAAEVQEEVQQFRQSAIAQTTDYATKTHAESQLDAFADMGHGYVSAIIETARDNRVCKKCAALDGKEIPIEQARSLIPVHPRCRCMWKPVMANPLASKTELEKRAKETLDQTISRLQMNVEQAAKEEAKAVKAATSHHDVETQTKAVQAQFERRRVQVLLLERNAARLRQWVNEIRQESEEFEQSQAAYQKKLESMKLDNAQRDRFAAMTINREKLVEYVRDVQAHLPDIDRMLRLAKAAYQQKMDKLAEQSRIQESVNELQKLQAKIGAIDDYLKRLRIFEPGSNLSRKIAEWRELVPRAVADARRLAAVMKSPVAEFDYQPITEAKIAKEWVGKYHSAASSEEKTAAKAYSDFDKFRKMNLMIRCERFEVLRDVYARVAAGTVTAQDEKNFAKYTIVDNPEALPAKQNVIADWKDILRLCVHLQNSGQHLVTEQPYVFTRRSEGFDFYGHPQIGDIINLNGFLSASGTAREVISAEGMEERHINMEIRVPAGIPFIPIGKTAQKLSADDVILPHGLQAKVVFIREWENPFMVLEIIPPKAGNYLNF